MTDLKRILFATGREAGPWEILARFALVLLPVVLLVTFVSPPPPPAGLGLVYATPAEVTVTTVADQPAPEHIIVLGDSTAEFLGRAFMSTPVSISNWGLRRCPLRPETHEGGVAPDAMGEHFDFVYPDSARAGTSCGWLDYIDDIDVVDASVVIYVGPMNEINFDDGHLPDIDFELVLVNEMGRLVRELRDRGAARVVLVLPPQSLNPRPGAFWSEVPRHDAQLGVLGVVHEVEPWTCQVDYASYAATQPDNRPDGSHMEGQGAADAARWMLAQIEACP